MSEPGFIVGNGTEQVSHAATAAKSRSAARSVDSRIMNRRLAGRDRLAWLVALIAIGMVVYLVLPLWALVGAVVMIIGAALLIRRSRRQPSRRSRRR
jgi:Flp pilus assembly protein TadB